MSKKAIEARDQTRLGLRRIGRLALSGMSHRLFRSTVTVAILALAVAFLMYTLGFGILEQATESAARTELSSSREMGQMMTRLGAPDSPSDVMLALSQGEHAAEYRAWIGSEHAADLGAATAAARHWSSARRALEGLPPAARASVLGDLSAGERLDSLSGEKQARALIRRLSELGQPPLLGDAEAFERFVVVERPALDGVVKRLIQGHADAVGRVQGALGDRPLLEAVAEGAPDLGEALHQAGFSLPSAGWSALFQHAKKLRDLGRVERGLLRSEVRAKLGRELGIAPGEVSLSTVVQAVGSDQEAIRELATLLHTEPGALGPDRLAELFAEHERERELTAVAGEEPTAGGFVFGLPSRTTWLILLSFLVCVVGVANAMLMSVTERFAEIATMKCLGAMDGAVLVLFVFEATLQGAVGGALGLVVGALLALGRGLFEYGGLLGGGLRAVPDLLLAGGLSFLLGVLLSALAAVGPALLAARLAPMEAMRVD